MLGLSVENLSDQSWEEMEKNLFTQLRSLEVSLSPGSRALCQSDLEPDFIGKEQPVVAAQTLQEHKDQGHVHYRRDCGDCLAGAGRRRPHRRVANPEPYVLSMDLAGPLRKGRQKEKYFLVAAYTLPEGEAVGSTQEEE